MTSEEEAWGQFNFREELREMNLCADTDLEREAIKRRIEDKFDEFINRVNTEIKKENLDCCLGKYSDHKILWIIKKFAGKKEGEE